MNPYYDKNGITLYCGDLRDVLPQLAEKIDHVVTDPPYGLSFMGRGWDHSVPGPEYWQVISDACKPGALLLAFGGTRTYHRLTCAIEDAGWDIRDCLMWLYGQGFPKAADVGKMIDKAKGAVREVVGTKIGQPGYSLADNGRTNEVYGDLHNPEAECAITAPATPEAAKWTGWANALKPAWEPIVLAMKPMDGTIANNALTHGVAGMNIDACRISCDYAAEYGESWLKSGKGKSGPWHGTEYEETRSVADRISSSGRWPANVLLQHHADCKQIGSKTIKGDQRGDCNGTRPGGFANVGAESGDSAPNARVYGNEEVPVYKCHPDCPVGRLDAQSGYLKSGSNNVRTKPGDGYHGRLGKAGDAQVAYGDSGGASRFFYCAKASKKERGQGNVHPTVKPLEVMRYLLTLLSTPTGGVILDPFAGSGTTLLAAKSLGRRCIGIELEPSYCDIIVSRLEAQQ